MKQDHLTIVLLLSFCVFVTSQLDSGVKALNRRGYYNGDRINPVDSSTQNRRGKSYLFPKKSYLSKLGKCNETETDDKKHFKCLKDGPNNLNDNDKLYVKFGNSSKNSISAEKRVGNGTNSTTVKPSDTSRNLMVLEPSFVIRNHNQEVTVKNKDGGKITLKSLTVPVRTKNFGTNKRRSKPLVKSVGYVKVLQSASPISKKYSSSTKLDTTLEPPEFSENSPVTNEEGRSNDDFTHSNITSVDSRSTDRRVHNSTTSGKIDFTTESPNLQNERFKLHEGIKQRPETDYSTEVPHIIPIGNKGYKPTIRLGKETIKMLQPSNATRNSLAAYRKLRSQKAAESKIRPVKGDSLPLGSDDSYTAGSDHKKHNKEGKHKFDKYAKKKGHKADSGFKSAKKGKYGKKHKSGHFNKHGKKYGGSDFKVKYHDDDKWKKKGKKGFDFGDKGHHKKGHKIKGFKNVYHKEEYHKKQKFYDDSDHKKHHKKYSQKDKKYLQKKGHKKKGHKKKGNKYGKDFGKKGHFKKGNFHDYKKGHKKKHGHKKKYGDEEHKFGKSSKSWDYGQGHGGHDHDTHGDYSHPYAQDHRLWNAPQNQHVVVQPGPPRRHPPPQNYPPPPPRNHPPPPRNHLPHPQNRLPLHYFTPNGRHNLSPYHMRHPLSPHPLPSSVFPFRHKRRKFETRRDPYPMHTHHLDYPKFPDPLTIRNSPYDDPEEDYERPDDLFEEPENALIEDPPEEREAEDNREEEVTDEREPEERPSEESGNDRDMEDVLNDQSENDREQEDLPSEQSENVQDEEPNTEKEDQNPEDLSEWEKELKEVENDMSIDNANDIEDIEMDPDFIFADVDDNPEKDEEPTADEEKEPEGADEPEEATVNQEAAEIPKKASIDRQNSKPKSNLEPKKRIATAPSFVRHTTERVKVPIFRKDEVTKAPGNGIPNPDFPSFESFGGFIGDKVKKSV